MEIVEVPYFKFYEEYGHSWKVLKPTGRWKLETTEYYINRLFVEHKGLLFNEWIDEGRIEMRPKRTSEIFVTEDIIAVLKMRNL